MIAEIINKQLMSNIFERCLLGEPGKRGESLKFILEKQVMSMWTVVNYFRILSNVGFWC